MIPVGDHKVLMAIVSAPGILLPLRNAHLGSEATRIYWAPFTVENKNT